MNGLQPAGWLGACALIVWLRERSHYFSSRRSVANFKIVALRASASTSLSKETSMVIRSALLLEKQNVHPGSPRFVGSVQLAVKQYNWFVALPIRDSASMYASVRPSCGGVFGSYGELNRLQLLAPGGLMFPCANSRQIVVAVASHSTATFFIGL